MELRSGTTLGTTLGSKSMKSVNRRVKSVFAEETKYNVWSHENPNKKFFPVESKVRLHFLWPPNAVYIVKKRPGDMNNEDYIMVHHDKPEMYGTEIPISAVHSDNARVSVPTFK